MDGGIRLRTAERKTALHAVRRGTDPEFRLRAYILLLLDAGQPWALIAAVLFTSSSTINRWRRRFLRHGLDGVLTRPRQSRSPWWAGLLIRWVTERTPADFGFARSRWTCEAAAVVLRDDFRVRVSRETVRRRLRAGGLVYRRPRPVLGPKDPAYAYKLGEIRRLLRELPAGEVVVFQDEVALNTNPKIGSMWMRRGHRAEVVTPGGFAPAPLAEENDVGHHGGALPLEGVRRQPDRPEEVRPVGRVLAGRGVLIVEGEVGRDQGQHPAGLEGVQRLGEEVVVRGEFLAAVVELQVGERDVADYRVDAALGRPGVLEALDADVGVGVQQPGDAAGDGVEFDPDE